MKYLINCFLLIIPVVIWNISFIPILPGGYDADIYWSNLPLYITLPEIILRMFVFFLPMFMPLKINKPKQKIGLILYLVGLLLYVIAWRPLILYPDSVWSTSLTGFAAPGFTPIIFLIGIGLIGNKLFFKIRYKQFIYIAVSFLFTFFHTWHLSIVYERYFG